MKKILLAAAAVALFSAPAFAAPEAFNLEYSNGSFRSSPPSGQESQYTAPERAHTDMTGSPQNRKSANWNSASTPASSKGQVIQASDDQAMKPMHKKHHHKKKMMDSTAPATPKAAPGASQPAGQGAE